MPQARTLEINTSWCKGCGICVSFCSHDVLGLNSDEKVVVTNIDGCTYCGDCEIRCPDFAIVVVNVGATEGSRS